MTKENALNLIRMTVFEFHRNVMIPLNTNIHLYDKLHHINAVKLHEQFFGFSDDVQHLYDDISKAIMEELDNFQTSQLLSLCRDISELYNLPVFKDMPRYIPDNSPVRYVTPEAADTLNYGLEDNTLEKLMSHVRKFGDEELTKRLAEVKSGQSRIVFEEMKNGTEGHTVFDNGKVTYRLNKKYEKVSDEADLWRASIILAHELQREPATGDLRGETADIVMRDMVFVEHLVSVHSEKIYERMPEFELLHLIKEKCGEEKLREFIDVAFNHTGSYWEGSIVSSRWIQRNWDELLALGIDIVEVITGVISLVHSFGISSLMIIHGGTNSLAVVIKIFITTSIALNIGDDEADIADTNMPSTAIGMIAYGIAALAIALTGFNYRSDDFKRLWGGIGDMFDFAIGLCLGLALRSAVKQALALATPQKLESLKTILRTVDKNILIKFSKPVYEFLIGTLGIINTSININEYYFQ
jgi:hypothetical protein